MERSVSAIFRAGRSASIAALSGLWIAVRRGAAPPAAPAAHAQCSTQQPPQPADRVQLQAGTHDKRKIRQSRAGAHLAEVLLLLRIDGWILMDKSIRNGQS